MEAERCTVNIIYGVPLTLLSFLQVLEIYAPHFLLWSFCLLEKEKVKFLSKFIFIRIGGHSVGILNIFISQSLHPSANVWLRKVICLYFLANIHEREKGSKPCSANCKINIKGTHYSFFSKSMEMKNGKTAHFMLEESAHLFPRCWLGGTCELIIKSFQRSSLSK